MPGSVAEGDQVGGGVAFGLANEEQAARAASRAVENVWPP